MVLVTDKQYYLDDHMKEVLDLCVRRHQKKWDNVLVIDGDERAGKSTMGRTMGYYYAWCLKDTIDLLNVFFDIDEMIEYAINNRNKVIIWDEAALGGLSSQWQEKIQQKLIQMLMIAGKYGHFFIFIIPSFFKLNWYLAVHRSLCLVNIYTPDMESRGLFNLFNKRQKAWIHANNKKSGMYSQPTFTGRFTEKNTNTIVDEEAYEAKKDAAIKKYLNNEDQEKDNFKIKKLKWFAANKMSLEEAQNFLNIGKRTYFEWKKQDLTGLNAERAGKSVVIRELQNGGNKDPEPDTNSNVPFIQGQGMSVDEE